MADFTNFVLTNTRELFKEKQISYSEDEFLSISNYCMGMCHNIFGDDRMKTNPEFLFRYDILEWMKNGDSLLDSFRLNEQIKISFNLSSEQYKLVQDNLSIFGNNKIGRSQVIKVVRNSLLYRKPEIIR